jgi:ribA/ribD-fused uncharacterized protein
MGTHKKILGFTGQYHFLSNFYPGEGFTSEHRFQSLKTLDPEWQEKILKASTPAKAKKLGREAPLRPDWDTFDVIAMQQALDEKFSDPKLVERLLATGDAYLEETNDWHDQHWGNCVCNQVANPRRGVSEKCIPPGENLLGKMLMNKRDALSKPKES